MKIDGVDYQIINSWGEVLCFTGISFKTRSTGVLVAHCPFHSEKTPSVRFWPGSGRFFCHGCHSTGDKLEWIFKIFPNLIFGVGSKEDIVSFFKDNPWIFYESSDNHVSLIDTGTLLFDFMKSV